MSLFKIFLGMMLLLGVSFSEVLLAQQENVRIGVLSHRGDELTLRTWKPTADYLAEELSSFRFEIVPLDFEEIDAAVAERQIDFLLANPGIYVTMEVRHRISRIATMNNIVDSRSMNVFGGVIFTRADNRKIRQLKDLKGHSLMAVDETSLGGFQMAWREMKKAGVDPYSDLRELRFAGIHDEVVKAVIAGEMDVGTVRTGILNSMAAEDLIDLKDVHIINDYGVDGFPLQHSTLLYPEWPFSKLQHTSNHLALKVAIALLRMSELDPAAQWGEYAGWTIPLEYQPVHDLLRDLGLPPYDLPGKFTLWDVVKKYFGWLLIISLLIMTLMTLLLWIYRLHRRLEESKYLLEVQHLQILDSVADGIYGVDLNGNSTFVNRAMKNMTGWQGSELIGHNQHELLHHTKMDGSPHPAEECPVFKTFMDDQPRFVEEDLFWRKDGSSFPVEYSANPIHDESGKTVGSVVVFRDISEKIRSREAEQQYLRELAHVARLSNMGEMASGLAHELNQPLTAIATNADASIRLLEQNADPARLMDVMERIGRQAHHAGGIIKHLREFVRKDLPKHSQTSVNQLIERLIILIRPEILRADVKLELDLEDGLPAVSMQKIHIDQVMINLLRNAIEAMAHTIDPKQLKISTRCVEQRLLRVCVSDNGPGVSADIQKNLFTPFVTSKEQGMGLGLSLSHGIINAHHGELFIAEPELGGATFCFTLPVNKRKK